MSQFLIVQGGHPEDVNRLYEEALAVYDAVCVLEPAAESGSGATRVAAFAREKRRGGGLVEREPGFWAVAVGTPFRDGAAGERAVEPLRHDWRDDAAFSTLDGTFVVACGDAAGEVAVATDRIGNIHAYEATRDGCAIVCTSSLVLAALLRPDWDIDSCREFLALGTVFEDRTLFRGIRKLGPASVYRYRGGKQAARSRYWSLADAMYDRSSLHGDVPGVARALEAVSADIVRNFAHPAIDLTGGFDSRIVVAALLRAGRPFETVVVGPKDDPDVVAAGEVASAAGLRLHVIARGFETPEEWWHTAKDAVAFTDGEYELLEYARILKVHRELQTRFDVSVNGSNGEICKGYWWELLFPHVGRKGHFDEERIARGRFAFSPQGASLLAEPYRADLTSHFAAVIRRVEAGFEDLPNTAKLDNVYLTMRMQRWHGRIASSTDRIWPNLSPFLFRGPLELALSAPPRARVRNRFTRRLLEHLNPRLADLPLAGGYPALPLRLSTAHRFAPLARDFGAKSVRKLVRKSAKGDASNPMRGLWTVSEVAEMLGDGMLTQSLYDRTRLDAFLRASQSENFGGAAQFGRILSLEASARAMKRSAKTRRESTSARGR